MSAGIDVTLVNGCGVDRSRVFSVTGEETTLVSGRVT